MIPVILSFTATPSTIEKGESTVLKWSTYGATSATLTSFAFIIPSGQKTVSPSASKTYVLKAISSDGVTEGRLTVTVVDTPPPPPPPPPGPVSVITFYTTPGECLVDFGAMGSKTSNPSGYLRFTDVPRTDYDYTVSKDGYTTHTASTTVTESKSIWVIITEIPEDEEEPPPSEEPPDFWTDPLGWILFFTTDRFSQFIDWFGTSFWTTIQNIQAWAAKFTIEFAIFLQDPAKYVNDAIRTFIIGREQKQATDYLDLRKNEEDHWQTGTDWIAGQYKTVDDLTTSEYEALIAKGLTDDKEALRAVDFRVYKLDASSKATLEQTMNALRTNVGGLWLGIDSKTGELLDTMNDGHTYVVNYVETLESNLPDTVGDIIQGIGSFINGGFLDFDDWALQFNLDIAGYTDSKIIDVKDWFNISLPEVISDMFEWAKPIVSPILGIADALSKLIGITDGTYPEDPKITEYKKETKRLMDEAKKATEE